MSGPESNKRNKMLSLPSRNCLEFGKWDLFYLFLKSDSMIFFYLYFIFGCAGSLLQRVGFSLIAASGGYSLVAVLKLLSAAPSLVARHRL